MLRMHAFCIQLSDPDHDIFLLAATSRLDEVNVTLREADCFSTELELNIPTAEEREDVSI